MHYCVVYIILAFIALVKSLEIQVVDVEPAEWRPHARIKHKELFLRVNMTRVVIECQADFPVRWHYEGVASPMQLDVKSYRKTGKSFENSTFSTQLRIQRVSAELTGKYVCSSFQFGRVKEYVYIYGDGHGYRGVDPILLQYGQTLSVFADAGKKVVFPCSTWKPRHHMKLYRKTANATYEEVKDSGILYNPRKGFVFAVTPENEDSILGTYICTPDIDITFDRVVVNLIRRPDFVAEPKTAMVEVTEGNNLRLACKSRQPVSFRWTRLNSHGLVTDLNQSDHKYPFGITLDVSNMTLNDEGVIECVGQQDAAVKHSWQFRVISHLDKSRRGWKKFHSRRTGLETFACWSKSSISPSVSFVRCTNPSECQIRGQCLKKNNKCDSVNTQLCPGGCALLTIVNQSGVLQCHGDGVNQQIQQFVGMSGMHYSNSTDELQVPMAEMLKVTMVGYDQSEKVLILSCTASGMYFTGGIRWGIKSRGQSTVELNGDHLDTLMSSSSEETFLPNGYIESTLRVRLHSRDSSSIPHDIQFVCLAPKLNSYEWAEAPYNFQNKGVLD